MTSPHDVAVTQAATPSQVPAPRPPVDPWTPRQPQPAWDSPRAVPHGGAWPPGSAPVDAPQAPDAAVALPGYAAAPYGQVPQVALPGYANAPAPSGPPVAPARYGGAPGWTSWDGEQRTGTNGLAVAAFVASWVFWPAALVMGPVALLGERRGGQSGRGWAVAAIVLSLIFATASVIVAAAVFSFVGSGQLAALPGAARGTAAHLQAVAVGQCFLQQGDKIKPVDCVLPHDGEVFLTERVMGTGTIGYPGKALPRAEAEAMCDVAFAKYVGLPYEQSQWEYTSWVPSEDSWASGDRAATCAIVPVGEQRLTGSASGSAV